MIFRPEGSDRVNWNEIKPIAKTVKILRATLKLSFILIDSIRGILKDDIVYANNRKTQDPEIEPLIPLFMAR